MKKTNKIISLIAITLTSIVIIFTTAPLIYIAGTFVFNEINLQIIAEQDKKIVEKYLIDEKQAKIERIGKEVGLVEDEIDIIVFFKNEPGYEYRFGVADNQVYQINILSCAGLECPKIGTKQYAPDTFE